MLIEVPILISCCNENRRTYPNLMYAEIRRKELNRRVVFGNKRAVLAIGVYQNPLDS
jgi:hypothetical protein